MNGRASHCFALNGNIFEPECNGLEGVLKCYRNAINKTTLYGPTYFNEIIAEINGRCEATEISNYNQEYHILLIITDGIINDMQKSIDEIVRGSDLPLSIVIVGVGDADFSSMDTLDADEIPLFSRKYNKKMSRDIV
jgi:vacuolar-type H+-ATPase subunit F/Vma7